jgi:Tol biopolymer transport system component
MRAVPSLAVRRRGALFAGVVSVLAVLVVATAGAAGGARAAGPQGTLVFASDRSGSFQIYSIRADGSRLGQLTRGRAADAAPLFSPDGRLIVFNRARKHDASELWVMSADGSGQRKLASSGSAPAWSPDSRRIAYIDARYGGALVIAGADGSARLVIRGSNLSPYWSPDGRLIAFSRQVGDRTNLMLIGGDGHALRMIRRNARALGWSPRGEIAFTGKYGSAVGLTSTSGRHARRLLPSDASALVWSPDERRLAFVDRNGLHVASADGGHVRRLPPKNANWVGSPAWSPDSRWIAIPVAPNGSTLQDLLLVAAEGSSSRLLTARVPRPWGTDYGPASWRPRGATPGRLGRPPVAPLPSETVSTSTFQPGVGRIYELAADGGLAVVVVHSEPRICAGIEAWEPNRRRVVRLQRQGCGDHGSVYEPAHGLAVAGRRVAWLEVSGGNTTQTQVKMATLERPAPANLAEGNADSGSETGTWASEPLGDGTLLAFTVEDRCEVGPPEPGNSDRCSPSRKTSVVTTVWRVGGQERCGPPASFQRPGCARVAQAESKLILLAVDAGRIAVRTHEGVRLLTASGKVLRDFSVEADTAALSGTRLALRTAGAVEIYDTVSGQRTGRFPVPNGVTLQDLEGDILVTASGQTATLQRLGDGRTVTLHTVGLAKAQLEQPGLFLAGAHRVTFTPMHDVLRRLGG